jgi:hypothetical protein
MHARCSTKVPALPAAALRDAGTRLERFAPAGDARNRLDVLVAARRWGAPAGQAPVPAFSRSACGASTR